LETEPLLERKVPKEASEVLIIIDFVVVVIV
jgi:hypothetical protein